MCYVHEVLYCTCQLRKNSRTRDALSCSSCRKVGAPDRPSRLKYLQQWQLQCILTTWQRKQCQKKMYYRSIYSFCRRIEKSQFAMKTKRVVRVDRTCVAMSQLSLARTCLRRVDLIAASFERPLRVGYILPKTTLIKRFDVNESGEMCACSSHIDFFSFMFDGDKMLCCALHRSILRRDTFASYHT